MIIWTEIALIMKKFGDYNCMSWVNNSCATSQCVIVNDLCPKQLKSGWDISPKKTLFFKESRKISLQKR